MYLVAGLGITGQSVLRYLQLTGESALAFDTRENFDLTSLMDSFPQVKFAKGDIPTPWKKQISTVVLSPGISVREPWVQKLQANGAQIIGDIELFARAVGVPVVALTGSNGKSTVTTMVADVLAEAGYQVAMGGNIGFPALDLLNDDNEYDVYVLELSSFQLETTYSLHTASSALLNISEDHMDRYDDMNAYLQAKLNVFNDTKLAICPTSLECESLATKENHRFGLGKPQRCGDYGVLHTHFGPFLAKGSVPLVAVEAMRLQGTHHQLNALATMALCEPFKVPPSVFNKVFANFKGLPFRTEEILQHRGIRWVNDSKGTNVGATLTALESIGSTTENTPGRLILIAGGVGKNAEFEALSPAIDRFCSTLILFGEDRQIIADALELKTAQMTLLNTLLESIELAIQSAKEGDVVLFSPACASFDQFDNYVHRGEMFTKWVYESLQLA